MTYLRIWHEIHYISGRHFEGDEDFKVGFERFVQPEEGQSHTKVIDELVESRRMCVDCEEECFLND